MFLSRLFSQSKIYFCVESQKKDSNHSALQIGLGVGGRMFFTVFFFSKMVINFCLCICALEAVT